MKERKDKDRNLKLKLRSSALMKPAQGYYTLGIRSLGNSLILEFGEWGIAHLKIAHLEIAHLEIAHLYETIAKFARSLISRSRFSGPKILCVSTIARKICLFYNICWYHGTVGIMGWLVQWDGWYCWIAGKVERAPL
uniref:Uncharacterized protein n=1 Tax=Romanomermis culicivorax TaxID=13658 RepID=A0A915JQ28_ROMCU